MPHKQLGVYTEFECRGLILNISRVFALTTAKEKLYFDNKRSGLELQFTLIKGVSSI